MTNPKGLYAAINAKRDRIAAGSGEKMRAPGAAGAPTAEAFRQSVKTAKLPAKTPPPAPPQVIRTTTNMKSSPMTTKRK